MKAAEQQWQTVLRQTRPTSRNYMIRICRHVAEAREEYRWWKQLAAWCDRHGMYDLGDKAMLEALKALRDMRKWRADRVFWWNWLKELSRV